MPKEYLTVGDIVEGTVSYLTLFGAFVDIEEVDYGALVHVSEIPDEDGGSFEYLPLDYFQIGEKRHFKVSEVDDTQKRIMLSLRGIVEIDVSEQTE